MNKATVCIGSNTPDKDLQLHCAEDFLRTTGDILAMSGIYETSAEQSCCETPSYLNEVLQLSTTYTLEELIKAVKEWERHAGRRGCKHSGDLVCIDIDIVVWNGEVVRLSDYNSPHFNIGYKKIS